MILSGRRFSRALSTRGAISFFICAVLVFTMAFTVAPAAQAAPPTTPAGTGFTGIDVDTSGGTVLAAGTGRISVSATNQTSSDLYNATGVVVLPYGVAYEPGSSAPGAPNAVGEPQILSWIPDPERPEQTAQVLVWSNVSDLPLRAEFDLSFGIRADNALYPVGSSFTVDAGVYANANERLVPHVTVPDEATAPVVDRASAGGDDSDTLTITALRLDKANLEAENEVYRGQANATQYSLTVTTAVQAGTDNVVVVDRVPAWFQVTNCELGDARFACSSRIIEDGGEVFTELTWNLGNVPAATSITLRYEAFVGLRQITAPSGEASGAATRPDGNGTGVVNTATAAGTYTGSVASTADPQITVDADAAVTVLDLGIVKSASRTDFFAGQTVDFTLAVRTSEFISTSDIVITDTLPDGLCPLVPEGAAVSGPWPQECDALSTGTVTGGTMVSAEAHSDGTFTLTFAVDGDALAEDEDATLTYTAFMRAAYQNGSNTASGDVARNVVDVRGVTDPVDTNTVDSGTLDSDNGSSASLITDGATLTKTVWTNAQRTAIQGVDGVGATCANAPSNEYVGTGGPVLQLGDVTCFRIFASFSPGTSTRDAVVADFLPPGTELVDWAAGPGNTVGIERPGSSLQWTLGVLNAADDSYYVQPGGNLVLDLLVRVADVPEAGADIDITGNLAKMRYTSGDGRVLAARDDVDLSLAPIVPLSLQKTVDGQSAVVVEEEQAVTYVVGVHHDGIAANGNDYPLNTVEVWDVLPASFRCADVTTAPGARCEDRQEESVLLWELSGTALGADGLFTGGETLDLQYTVTIPAPLSISTAHTNTAAVTRYTAPTTDGTADSAGDIPFYPENPVGAYADETPNAPEASDTATVSLGDASVSKQITATSSTAPGNDATTEATIGENVEYAYSVTIPAHTSVFDGILDDGLPTGSRLVQVGDASMVSAPDGVTVTSGCTQDDTEIVLCADGTLRFPDTWTNPSDAPAVFRVAFTARVADVAANQHGTAIPNTATFRSASTANGELVSRGTASASVNVVEPAPVMQKAASSRTVAGGTVVTYTLTASNTAGRPPLYDAVVTDCVPSALTIDTLPSGIAGPVAGTGSNGCATGTQRIEWTVPAAVQAGAPQTTQYTVSVPASAPAGRTYTNSATLRGSSLEGAVSGERTTYSANTTETVTVRQPGLTKTRSSATVVPGQSIDWTVTATIPANVTMFDAAFIDSLPAAFGNSSVTEWDISCGPTWTTPCPAGTQLTASSTAAFGVSVGEIAADDVERVITLTLTTRLPASNNTNNGTTLTNTAFFRWNLSEAATPPTTTGGTWDANQQATATTQVRHPQVTVAKSVDDTTPAQAQTLTYTVRATATASRGVTAYDVKIVDTVPAGIVVLGPDGEPLANGAATASGGVWADGARTLTWTVPQMTAGAIRTFTYPARLVPASQLTGAALENRVVPAAWDSLDDGGRTYPSGTASTASVTPQFPRIDAVKTQVAPTANPVYIGEEVTFQFELTNVGGATAASLDAVDTLPDGWTYVSGSAQVAVRGGAAVSTEPTIDGGTLRWNDIGGSSVALQAGERITVTYRAVAGDGVTVGASVPHTNTVTAADVVDETGSTSYNAGAGTFIGRTGESTTFIASADLAVTKVANDDFIAGATGTYTITVTNNGPDPAVGVTVTDSATVPDGVTISGASGDGWTCSTPEGGDLTCTRTTGDALAPGASWTLTARAAVAADVADATEIPNTATVTARTEDPNDANNESADIAVVDSRADLRIVKTAPSQAVAGLDNGIEWTLTVTNIGPSVSRGSDATPIVVTDDLPDGVTDISVTSADADVDCSIQSGTARCEIPFDLAVGASVVATVTGTVDSSVAPGTTIENTAVVTAVTTDPVEANDTSTSTTDVVVQEALTVDKSIIVPADAQVPIAGETITYRLVVNNAGPSDARGVSVFDALPDGLVFESIVAGGNRWTATAAGDDVRLALSGTLPAGESMTVDIQVRVAASVEGRVTNTATVSSDWKADQDTSSVDIGSRAVVDLAVAKSIDAATVVAGASTPTTYTLTVTNAGPSDSAGPVILDDLLPAGMTVAEDVDGCTVTDVSGRDEVRCEKTDGMDAGEQAWVVRIPVLVDADVSEGTLTNTATVSGPTADSDPTNNSASVSVAVLQRAALTVAKSAPDTAVAGENVTWTVTVTNNGPSDAQNVSVTDALDSRLSFVSATSTTETTTCSGTTTVTCLVGTLPVGASVDVVIVTTVASSLAANASIANTAIASSTTIDPTTDEPASAEGDDTVTVLTRSALTIDKSVASSTVDAGGIATYTIQVSNQGPSDTAAPVTVVDTLPAGMSFIAATGWSCEPDGRELTCVLESGGNPVSLAAGADAPALQISARVSAALEAGTLTNTATASSPNAEESVTDDADVAVLTHADLELVKSHANGTRPTAGLGFTWTIEVTNHGPSDSVATAEQPIVIRDTLPAGVTLSQDTPSGGTDVTCTTVGEDDGRQVVECPRTTTLPVGDSVVVTLHVDVDASVSGDLENTATVTPGATPQPEEQTFPDTDTDSVPVREVADLTVTKDLTTDTVVAGQEISWSVTVSNLGPSDSNASVASPITVVDTLPGGVTGATANGDGWACTTTSVDEDGREVISCVRTTTLPVGAAPVITVTGTVDPGFRGSLTNDVVVSPGLTPQPQEQVGPDTASVTGQVTESADVAITKTLRDSVVAGSTGTYRFQVVNLGPSDARSVVVRDTLPAGLSFAESVSDGWDCQASDPDERDVVCTLDRNLLSGEVSVLDVTVNADQRLQGNLTNTATVESATPDPQPSNNSSVVVGLLAESADLSIVKQTVGTPVVGGTFQYALTVANVGPSTARGVVVADDVPAQLLVQDVAGDGWSCIGSPTEAGHTTVNCLLDELAAGVTAPAITVTVQVLPSAYPTVSNTASVTSATPESEATISDNTSTVTDTVPALSDLTVTKELTRNLEAGFTGEYTITVTNAGPTPDPGPVTVTDRLPAGLTYRSATLDGAPADCTASGATVTCLIGALAANQTATLVMQVDVASSAAGTVVNTVAVTSAADPESPEATATAEIDRTKLALTGAAPWMTLMLALMLLLAGAAVILYQRSRREVP